MTFHGSSWGLGGVSGSPKGILGDPFGNSGDVRGFQRASRVLRVQGSHGFSMSTRSCHVASSNNVTLKLGFFISCSFSYLIFPFLTHLLSHLQTGPAPFHTKRGFLYSWPLRYISGVLRIHGISGSLKGRPMRISDGFRSDLGVFQLSIRYVLRAP